MRHDWPAIRVAADTLPMLPGTPPGVWSEAEWRSRIADWQAAAVLIRRQAALGDISVEADLTQDVGGAARGQLGRYAAVAFGRAVGEEDRSTMPAVLLLPQRHEHSPPALTPSRALRGKAGRSGACFAPGERTPASPLMPCPLRTRDERARARGFALALAREREPSPRLEA
jgi:hypothetical protein